MEGAGKLRTFRLPRFVIGLVFMLALLLAPALASVAEAVDVSVVAQETPYQPPEIQEVETPSWLQPLQPLARLPLWGQAAVLSAGVAGMFFVVPMVGKWLWKLGEDGRSEQAGSDQ
jgi:hypothetical protein